MQNEPHVPVMLKEVINYMAPKDGEVYVDGTFGAGGYSRGLLKTAKCKVYGIDRDPSVTPFANRLAQEFPGKFELLLGKFSEMGSLLEQAGIKQVDGIVLDIGISSMQVDEAGRGFSFMREGPLDMRMGSEGIDAAHFINNAIEKDIANVIYNYGGEKKSRRVAKAIVEARAEAPITTTTALAAIIRRVVRGGKDKIDPATRTFQAIRIWVNDELGELERALVAAEKILAPGGRLVIVSFHSLEDSIIKEFFNLKSGKIGGVSRHAPVFDNKKTIATFEILTRKVVIPSDAEMDTNIRSRSAKLRAAKKVA